jgi:hypothetical protein
LRRDRDPGCVENLRPFFRGHPFGSPLAAFAIDDDFPGAGRCGMIDC